MRIIKKIKNKKFLIISIFMFSYVTLNLLDGERGLISYYDKAKVKKNLIVEEKILRSQLASVEKKISYLPTLLIWIIQKQYIEINLWLENQMKNFILEKLNENKTP